MKISNFSDLNFEIVNYVFIMILLVYSFTKNKEVGIFEIFYVSKFVGFASLFIYSIIGFHVFFLKPSAIWLNRKLLENIFIYCISM